MSESVRVVTLLGLVAANAFLVIGEYAIVTARRVTLAASAERDKAGARAALRLMDDPVRVMSTAQVGVTAVGILTGAIAEPLVRDVVGDAFPRWLGFLVAFTVITFGAVVFGELVPKALTLDRPERMAMRVAPAIDVMSRALRPIVALLETSAQAVLRLLGVREVAAGAAVRSPDELRAVVDEAEATGVIPRAQEELIHNVFDFPHREVRDVMVPAPEVVWLDAAAAVDAALDEVVGHPYSRYPVGDGSLDRIVGVVHVRDLVAAARHDPHGATRGHAHPAPIVPETKHLGALLSDLRERRQHLAIVVDEYGGTAGIATLEDLLEELVGEIEDEFDLPDNRLRWIDDHTVCISGSMTIDDFNEAVGTALPHESVHTMAGLVFDRLGRRPAPGDAVSVDGVTVVVERVEGLRITWLRVAVPTRA